MVREGIFHLPSYAMAKKLKLLTLRAHDSHGASVKGGLILDFSGVQTTNVVNQSINQS